MDLKCPKDGCGGDVVERRTRGAKIFWGCSKYPKCDFASWYKPVAQKCPNCDSKYMVEKDTKKDGAHLYCPECKHKVHQAGGTGADARRLACDSFS